MCSPSLQVRTPRHLGLAEICVGCRSVRFLCEKSEQVCHRNLLISDIPVLVFRNLFVEEFRHS